MKNKVVFYYNIDDELGTKDVRVAIGPHEDIHEYIEAFKGFLAAIGFHSNTIKEYLTSEEELWDATLKDGLEEEDDELDIECHYGRSNNNGNV